MGPLPATVLVTIALAVLALIAVQAGPAEAVQGTMRRGRRRWRS